MAVFFFESILDVFPLHTRIFVVKFRDASVAAGFATIFQKAMEVPWAGSLIEHRSLCPICCSIGKRFNMEFSMI